MFRGRRCAEAGAFRLVLVDSIIRLVSWTQFERVGQLEVGGKSGASMWRVVSPPRWSLLEDETILSWLRSSSSCRAAGLIPQLLTQRRA